MKISQAEARRLKRRVRELEDVQRRQRSYWSFEYPGGVNILTLTVANEAVTATIKTAQLLNHTVVVKHRQGELLFYAIPQVEEQKL